MIRLRVSKSMRLPRTDRRFFIKVRMLAACALAGIVPLLSAGAIAAQACLQPGSGIGGTGAQQGGIGGTGMPAAGGTGGTGDQADFGVGGTGIVGTITGFASVCIGELEVHFDSSTPVSMNGRSSSLNRLALGQVVAMEAGAGAKGLTARSIAILNALEGPVTRTEPNRGVFEVMGQPVRLAPAVDVSRITAGSSVRVSGLRDVQGVVHATRVEPAADLRAASAIGLLHRDGAVANLDGLSVAGVGARAAGSELLVRGKWDGRHLQVREWRADPSLPFAGRVRDVVAEGLVHRRSEHGLQISGFEVLLTSAGGQGRDAVSGIVEGSLVRVVGRLEPGRRITARRVEIDRGRSRGGAEDRAGARGPGKNSDDSDDGGRSSGGVYRGSDDRRGIDGSKGGKEPGGRGDGSGDRGSRMEKVDKVEKSDKLEKPEKMDRLEKVEKNGKAETAVDRAERTVKPESGRSGRN